MNESKIFLIDTNSLLHYHLFTEINWCDELSCDKIILIMPPTVLKELDKIKFSDSDIDIRNRARKVLSKISENINKNNVIDITPKIQLRFIVNEPKINWEMNNLDPNIPDDRIIASALEFISLNEKSVTLITSDIGLSLKSQNKSIATHALSDSLLLKLKKTEEEKEILKLKNKLAVLENRLPKLLLRFIIEDVPSKLYSIDIKQIAEYSTEQTNNFIKSIKDKLVYVSKEKYPANVNQLLGINLHIDEINRYEKDVNEYLKDLEVYYKKEWEYREIISRIIKIRFILINEGTAPADDVDIFTHFPDGFEMFDSEEYPEQPKLPEEPMPPRTFAEIMKSNLEFRIPSSLLNTIPRYNNISLPNKADYSPKIKKTNSFEVRFKVEKLKHGMNISLDPVYLRFDDIKSAQSFSIDYKIISGNHPENFVDKLHLKINKEREQ